MSRDGPYIQYTHLELLTVLLRAYSVQLSSRQYLLLSASERMSSIRRNDCLPRVLEAGNEPKDELPVLTGVRPKRL